MGETVEQFRRRRQLEATARGLTVRRRDALRLLEVRDRCVGRGDGCIDWRVGSALVDLGLATCSCENEQRERFAITAEGIDVAKTIRRLDRRTTR